MKTYCSNCKTIYTEQYCPVCENANQVYFSQSNKNIKIAILLCVILGAWGGHRFYLGRYLSGVIQLLMGTTFIGLIFSSIWAAIDLFFILTQRFVDKDNKTLAF